MWWLGAIRHQALTRASVDLDLCRHMTSLDYNESLCFISLLKIEMVLFLWNSFSEKDNLFNLLGQYNTCWWSGGTRASAGVVLTKFTPRTLWHAPECHQALDYFTVQTCTMELWKLYQWCEVGLNEFFSSHIKLLMYFVYKWLEGNACMILCWLEICWCSRLNSSYWACHPGGHYWDYYPGALSSSQIIVIHLKIGHS